MMSVSNGFISSDKNEKKRSLENGCSPTKWKARKVSAARDFPPGCGPSSLPPASIATDHKGETLKANRDFPPGRGPNNSSSVSSDPQEVVSVSIAADDTVEVPIMYAGGVPITQVGSLPHESVKSYPQADEPPINVKFSEAENVNGSTNDHAIGVPEEVFVKKEFQNGDIQTSLEVNGSGAEYQASVKEEVHHEAQIMVKSETEKKTMLEAGCGMADAGLQVGVVQPTSPSQVTVTDSKTKDGSPPKNKYRRRRISAVRDFPPFCGWNAPEPPEAERLKILGNKGSASSDKDNGVSWRSVEQVIVGSDVKEGSVADEKVSKNEPKTGPEPRLKSHAVIQDSDKGGRNQVGQKIVAYNRARINRDKSSVAEFGDKGKSLCSKDAMIAPTEVSKGNVGNKEALNSKAEGIGTDPRYSSCDASEELNGAFQDDIVLKSESEMVLTEPKNRSHAIVHERDKHIDGPLRKMDREKSLNTRLSDDNVGLGCTSEGMMTVLGLMAAPYCPWRPAKWSPAHPDASKSSSKKKKLASVTPKNSMKIVSPRGKSSTAKRKSSSSGKGSSSTLDLMVKNEEAFFPDNAEQRENSPAAHGLRDFDVSLPPFGPKSSTDDRNKVREILRLYQAICRKLLQTEEARMREGKQGKDLRRIDLAAAKILKDKGKEVNPGIKMVGAIPGVEIGDEFQYRVELAIVGVHRLYQAGIDFLKQGEQIVATSIVASGGYDDDLENPNCLIYSGSGGVGKDKQHEDQKLERGNLALKNSISVKNPVRVIRGAKGTRHAESSDARAKMVITYIYDGLYTVEKYWQDPGPNGNLFFKFELKRIPGQPELALKEVKRSKKFKTREGRCVDDISGGKEPFPICAVNTIDNEKPPPFNYINEIIYPDWYQPLPSGGCDCKGPCSDNRCPCAIKNGGEIPYNHNGAIVEIKPLVYECGISCKCPPSCYNRVTQYGMKIQLEIFKTESRGWGVRSLNSISSGSFICEYIGELLEDREAEKRTGNDEYLFDIGQNYADCSVNPDANPSSNEFLEDGGFTIDAANSGNVGRFINHSCSPNLYAQNVLYDQEDKRMPHIMFFAAENIPPLQELTYHYNYKLDTVFDADGNVKIKHCYCGSAECTGRMY